MTKRTTDYLAVILVGVGSCWGRSPDKEAAVKNALRIYKKDAGSMFKIRKGDKVVVNVVEVSPHDEVSWETDGLWADGEKLDRKIEQEHRIVP